MLRGLQDGQDALKRDIADIKALVERRSIDLASELMKRYPLGYVLYYGDGKQIGYVDTARKDLRFDAASVAIEEVSDRGVLIVLPNVEIREHKALFFGNAYGIAWLQSTLLFQRNQYRIWVESLGREGPGALIVVGVDDFGNIPIE